MMVIPSRYHCRSFGNSLGPTIPPRNRYRSPGSALSQSFTIPQNTPLQYTSTLAFEKQEDRKAKLRHPTPDTRHPTPDTRHKTNNICFTLIYSS